MDASIKKDIEEKLEALKKVLPGDDSEAMKKAAEELAQASMKLGEAIYKAAQEKTAKEGAPAGEGAKSEEKPKDAGAVDAEYEPVDKDKK